LRQVPSELIRSEVRAVQRCMDCGTEEALTAILRALYLKGAKDGAAETIRAIENGDIKCRISPRSS